MKREVCTHQTDLEGLKPVGAARLMGGIAIYFVATGSATSDPRRIQRIADVIGSASEELLTVEQDGRRISLKRERHDFHWPWVYVQHARPPRFEVCCDNGERILVQALYFRATVGEQPTVDVQFTIPSSGPHAADLIAELDGLAFSTGKRTLSLLDLRQRHADAE